ncbi:MAG: UDP-2,3-diacylglucosamine diphosphatase [Thiotrichaceae bacterium]|nr:UDP-2,3-diacylglucosamine diphosphatase [Thiotrichaceae bacterium]
MKTLFISDLHLCASRPAITQLFIEFLHKRLQAGDRLYILGDLFETWLGDDAIDTQNQAVIDALQGLHQKQIPVFIMHGNRDFLLGDAFASATGAILIDDPCIVELDGTEVLLMHGDTLCTDDVDYQAFRLQIRNPTFCTEFLSYAIEKRIAIASQFRQESRHRAKQKSAEIMDVNQATVEQVMKKYHVQHLIHGHTHRPAQHHFELDGSTLERTVLGDWYHQGSVLRYNGHFTLETLPL